MKKKKEKPAILPYEQTIYVNPQHKHYKKLDFLGSRSEFRINKNFDAGQFNTRLFFLGSSPPSGPNPDLSNAPSKNYFFAGIESIQSFITQNGPGYYLVSLVENGGTGLAGEFSINPSSNAVRNEAIAIVQDKNSYVFEVSSAVTRQPVVVNVIRAPQVGFVAGPPAIANANQYYSPAPAIVELTRQGDLTRPLTVQLTRSGTASSANYNSTIGNGPTASVTFPIGQSTVPIVVTPTVVSTSQSTLNLNYTINTTGTNAQAFNTTPLPGQSLSTSVSIVRSQPPTRTVSLETIVGSAANNMGNIGRGLLRLWGPGGSSGFPITITSPTGGTAWTFPGASWTGNQATVTIPAGRNRVDIPFESLIVGTPEISTTVGIVNGAYTITGVPQTIRLADYNVFDELILTLHNSTPQQDVFGSPLVTTRSKNPSTTNNVAQMFYIDIRANRPTLQRVDYSINVTGNALVDGPGSDVLYDQFAYVPPGKDTTVRLPATTKISGTLNAGESRTAIGIRVNWYQNPPAGTRQMTLTLAGSVIQGSGWDMTPEPISRYTIGTPNTVTFTITD